MTMPARGFSGAKSWRGCSHCSAVRTSFIGKRTSVTKCHAWSKLLPPPQAPVATFGSMIESEPHPPPKKPAALSHCNGCAASRLRSGHRDTAGRGVTTADSHQRGSRVKHSYSGSTTGAIHHLTRPNTPYRNLTPALDGLSRCRPVNADWSSKTGQPVPAAQHVD
jgi:hypothetical protein